MGKNRMSKPSLRSIRQSIKALRVIIDANPATPLASRAYDAETLLRWATEETRDWPKPEEYVKHNAG